MLELVFRKKFKKERQLAKERGWNISELDNVIRMLANGQRLPPKYGDHGLGGKWNGCRDCHVRGDWVLIYEITKTELILHRFGTHSDLFGH
jgi:mRNA interferase YafQ